MQQYQMNFLGQKYHAKTILITFPITFEKDSEFHHTFKMYEENLQFSLPGFEIHVLEVQKVKKNDDSPLAQWLQFFAAENEEDYGKAAQTSSAISEAWAVIKTLMSK